MATITEHGARCGTRALCGALGFSAATYYRATRVAVTPKTIPAPRSSPPRTLLPAERQHVLDVLHAPRFIDLAPAQVYAALLDEGTYHCSERTMYRVLAEQHEIRERRAQRRHPLYAAPELLATAPNQLWSWDITKLKGPVTWSWYHLYVILDVFSRYVVGWMVAPKRVGRACRATDRHLLRETEHCSRTTNDPRRSRPVDDIEARRSATR